MSFFWYSHTGGDEAWKCATSDQRAHITSSVQPAFVTVLDSEASPQPDWTREDYLKMKYSGPLYFDWDASEDADGIAATIPAVQSFLRKLQGDHQVDLRCIRLFATGGRGFHAEIPAAMLMAKPAPVTLLPLAYREVALDLATEHMDLRIYSTKRGRMWRVPNVQRSNGAYKVPVTADEVMGMTAERYVELTRAPRHYFGDPSKIKDSPWLYSQQGTVPPPLPPSPAPSLQALFAEKRAQVEATSKKQTKVHDERQKLARFKGETPPSLLRLMGGEGIRTDMGFNAIALQLAITGAAFGMDESTFMSACEGFTKSHSGDGSRYNSPRKRQEALRDRFHYVQESPVYVFTLAGLKSICEPGAEPPELFGLASADDLPYEDITDRERVAVEVATKTATLGGMYMLDRGIYAAGREGKDGMWLTDAVFQEPLVLKGAEDGDVRGFVVSVGVYSPDAGKPVHLKRAMLGTEVFRTRQSMDDTLARYGSSFSGTDAHAAKVRRTLQALAERDNRMQYIVHREGIDLIRDPDSLPGTPAILAWVTEDQVLRATDDLHATAQNNSAAELEANQHHQKVSEGEIEPPRLVYRPLLSANLTCRMNIHRFAPVNDDPAFRAWFRQLCQINRPSVVGRILGWFVSCFHRQLHHHVHRQFPLLMVYGTAGSGKSTTPTLMYHLFSGNPPSGWEAVGRGLTTYAFLTRMMSNTTAPLIIDEFKRASLAERVYNEYLGYFRGAYNQLAVTRGGFNDGSATKDYRQVKSHGMSAPLAILSETAIGETAIMERSVAVGMMQEGQNTEAWSRAASEEGRAWMSRLGALLLRQTLQIDLDGFAQKYHETYKEVRDKLGSSTANRPITNMTVVLMGLDFLDAALRAGAGVNMSSEISHLRNHALRDVIEQARRSPVKAEAYKALSDISYITRNEPHDSRHAIREGVEYIFTDNGMIDIDVEAVFKRYNAYIRPNNLESYYSNEEAFAHGLALTPGVVDTRCAQSKLRRSASATIFRLDPRVLQQKGVTRFRSMAAEDA